MNASFLVLCIGAVATIAYTCSVLCLPLLLAIRRGLLSLTPRAEARLLFAVAVLPLVVSLSAVAASVAPPLSTAHHCLDGLDPHDHPHLCGRHQTGALPGGVPVFLAALLLASSALGAARLWFNARIGRQLRGALGGIAQGEADYRVLPLPEPQAFLIGAVRPQLFVTRGLLSAHAEHVDVVLAHERAHLEFRHPLVRALAKAALCFHLPVLAHAVERALDMAHEMAADAEAARRVGSPERVASTLLQLTRATLPLHPAVTAFGCSHVERRVVRLLDARPTHDVPSPRSLLVLAAVALLAITIAAEPIHHGLEMTLGLLGS